MSKRKTSLPLVSNSRGPAQGSQVAVRAAVAAAAAAATIAVSSAEDVASPGELGCIYSNFLLQVIHILSFLI